MRPECSSLIPTNFDIVAILRDFISFQHGKNSWVVVLKPFFTSIRLAYYFTPPRVGGTRLVASLMKIFKFISFKN